VLSITKTVFVKQKHELDSIVNIVKPTSSHYHKQCVNFSTVPINTYTTVVLCVHA